MTGATPSREKRRFELALFLFVFLIAAYFANSGSWNQNARLDAIYSFVEPGPDQFTFKINRFIWDAHAGKNTGDWALYHGDYFANKAPGTVLLGVLFYLPLHWFETSLLGLDAFAPAVEILNAYLINLFVSVLFTALASVAFLRLLERSKVERCRALFLTLAAFLGTAVFPYSTQLWGSSTTTAFVVFGYLWLLRDSRSGMVLAGVSLGTAVCVDHLAGLFVLLAGALVVLRRRRLALHFIAGGLVPLLVLMTYQYYCFGNPLTTAPSLSNRTFIDEGRLFGFFGLPSLNAAWELSFGVQRGVFQQMPVLLLALPGFFFWWQRDRRDPLLWLSALSFFLLWLLVSSFNGWHGGATIAARYLIPSLPWLVVALKELPRTRGWWVASAGLTTLSAINMLVIAATNPLGAGTSNPLYGWAYAHFFAADLGPVGLPTRLQALHPAWSAFAPFTCVNWGELLGLRGSWSLIPLGLVVTLGLGVLVSWAGCRVKRRAPSTPLSE